jgi:hypothetical protein
MQRLIALILTMFIVLALSSCSDDKQSSGLNGNVGGDATGVNLEVVGASRLTVYKTPSCSCCSAWVDHILVAGLKADVVNQDSVAHIKDLYGVPVNARSCHTAISDSNHIFEGHVPAKYILQFLASPPDGAKGLVVPAMPLGSPGMDSIKRQGVRQFNPYQVFLMGAKGELTVYADVGHYDAQF